MRYSFFYIIILGLFFFSQCKKDDDCGCPPQPDNETELYYSKDYSMDKTVKILQQASKGEGIDIVLIGEAFVDLDMGPGCRYETAMKAAMEAFFALEPTKSFREYFNVYMVYAVSENNVISDATNTCFGASAIETPSSIDYNLCYSYAAEAFDDKDLQDVTIILTVNNLYFRAATHIRLFDNAAIAFSPFLLEYLGELEYTIIHEAVGHGFAKLADEYGGYDEEFPSDVKEAYLDIWMPQGYWQNIDFTYDPEKVRWSHFIKHPLYPEVGVFEGGDYYDFGVWHSEEESAMKNFGVHYFNVRCRELIYKKIKELAGEVYSLEEFLEYDKINLMTTRSHYPMDVHSDTFFKKHFPPILQLE